MKKYLLTCLVLLAAVGAQAGHGALLSPPPPVAVLDEIAAELLGAFFRKHLLP